MKIGGIHIVLLARRLFAERYAGERGWNVDDLAFDQLMEIRKQPGWRIPAMDCVMVNKTPPRTP